MASLLGSAGQAGYSAANAALDAHAMLAQRSGCPVTAVQWGLWAGAGMAAGAAAARTRLQRLGLGMLTAQQGLTALGNVLAKSSMAYAVQAAIVADWPRLLGGLHPDAQAMFSELSGAVELAATSSLPHISAAAAGQLMPSAADGQRLQEVVAWVANAVEAVVGKSVGVNDPLMASGLDSLGAVELLSALEVCIALTCTASYVSLHPSQ